MWGHDQVEASGVGSKRIHLRWDKGDGSLLNTQQGSGGLDNKGELVFKEAVGGGRYS